MSNNPASALVLVVVLASGAGPACAEIDLSLQGELLRMMESDQSGRLKIQDAEKTYGPDSSQVRVLWDAQYKIDAENLRRLKNIVAVHGWPGQSLVGPEAAMGAFLIIQHADHATQVEYLPLIRKAVEGGDLPGQVLAFLEDRILLAEGKKQIYGTQLKRNEVTGELELQPIEDEPNVDARRATLGMPPLADYLKRVLGNGGG